MFFIRYICLYCPVCSNNYVVNPNDFVFIYQRRSCVKLKVFSKRIFLINIGL